ncbi:MAG TPA: hypothetical protein VF574_14990 [Allosphingosinicella sp.]|jgi:hypothetical protein
MAVSAYSGGIAEIRGRPEWRDAVHGLLTRIGQADPGKPDDVPAPIRLSADFSVLRRLHAQQAEILATKPFSHGTAKTQMFLLDDQDLRDAYGATIGKVAHSHHWDIDRLPHELRQHIGALPSFPEEWTVNAVKVAAILRTADASHIDADRAPRMLFALNRPRGVSLQHWTFQNKVLQSTVRGDKLLFSSREPFQASEALSWWLGYDVITMIDRELTASSDLLERLDLPRFRVSGVVGAESPKLLARHIETEGWMPVSARVKVSDPTHLARTLGGKNLYGNNIFAPIRELLSNAVDAVRARRIEERRPNDWGEVRIVLERDPKGDSNCYWLHVDDNGLGMSEPVLTGSLLDFGTSFWNSSGLQDEYPGLISRGFKPVGKFGIGFFSAFLLGDHVKVCSRPFSDAMSSSRVLEFSSLDEQPILREADREEAPRDFITRVSVQVDEEKVNDFRTGRINMRGDLFGLPAFRSAGLHAYLRRLVATLDVSLFFIDEITQTSFRHKPNWQSMPAEVLVSDLEPDLDQEDIELVKELFTFVKDGERTIGVAGLPLAGRILHISSYTSVDGFTYSNAAGSFFDTSGNEAGYAGILPGHAEDASREVAPAVAPPEALQMWASQQAARISRLSFASIDGMKAAQEVLALGGDSGSLPFTFHQAKFLTYAETSELVHRLDEVLMPVELGYSSSLTPADALRAPYFTNPLIAGTLVAVAREVNIHFLDDHEAQELKESEADYDLDAGELQQLFEDPSLSPFVQLLERHWGGGAVGVLTHRQVFEPTPLSTRRREWVLSIRRGV